MSAHTPGPWSAQRGKGWRHWEIFACDDVETYVAGTNEDNDHEEANARLIASAPELLDALQNMLGAFDNAVRRLKFKSEFGDEAICTARAAIAKATGGAK